MLKKNKKAQTGGCFELVTHKLLSCPLTETYQTLYNTVQINLIRKEVHHIMEVSHPPFTRLVKENTLAVVNIH